MEWYLKVLKNYVGFSGRASRKEYWMFILFHILFIVAAGYSATLFESVLNLQVGPALIGIYLLATALPALAVTVRRLHDTGRSGWAIFVRLIPVVGGIIFLVYVVTEGDIGSNRYGPDPYSDESLYDRIDEIGD